MLLSVSLTEVALGVLLSLLISLTGYWRRALTLSGVAGAMITGTLIFGMGGWEWGALLLGFFLSSSLLSFYRSKDKAQAAEKFAKGHRRDLEQALANGGVAALLAVCSRIWPSLLWFAACAGSLAAVNADTWATELGVLSRRPPRLITTGRLVEVGTSGGVTWMGVGASLLAALFIGALAAVGAALTHQGLVEALTMLLGALLGGISGSLIDSLLGATVQAIYWCETCDKETESVVHRCGTRTYLVRGWALLNNDLVNLLASLTGALVAAAVGWSLLRTLRL
jgi:uncharacterized protein (TIGR00297 family)